VEFGKRYLLLWLTIYMTLYTLNIVVTMIDRSDFVCDLQSALFQGFGAGFLSHEAMISFQLYQEMEALTRCSVHQSVSVLSVDSSYSEAMWNQVPRKLIVFEVIVFVYAVLSFVLAFFFTDAEPTPGIGTCVHCCCGAHCGAGGAPPPCF
jgi:hypothetical protein